MISSIIKQLTTEATRFNSITSLPKLPGIYAFSFFGKHFPLLGYSHTKNDILYIGKTESSAESRNLNTHFKTGMTGSSTIRRTLGALLLKELDLKPVPRNKVDLDAGRTHTYKFDADSEEKLTEWMCSNLGLSFYTYDKSKAEISSLEFEIIRTIVPPLNLQSNPGNTFAKGIKEARKITADLAFSTEFESKRL